MGYRACYGACGPGACWGISAWAMVTAAWVVGHHSTVTQPHKGACAQHLSSGGLSRSQPQNHPPRKTLHVKAKR